ARPSPRRRCLRRCDPCREADGKEKGPAFAGPSSSTITRGLLHEADTSRGGRKVTHYGKDARPPPDPQDFPVGKSTRLIAAAEARGKLDRCAHQLSVGPAQLLQDG